MTKTRAGSLIFLSGGRVCVGPFHTVSLGQWNERGGRGFASFLSILLCISECYGLLQENRRKEKKRALTGALHRHSL